MTGNASEETGVTQSNTVLRASNRRSLSSCTHGLSWPCPALVQPWMEGNAPKVVSTELGSAPVLWIQLRQVAITMNPEPRADINYQPESQLPSWSVFCFEEAAPCPRASRSCFVGNSFIRNRPKYGLVSTSQVTAVLVTIAAPWAPRRWCHI